LSGIFRKLKACEQVDIARRTAYVRFLYALRFLNLAELSLQLRHRPLLVRDASFVGFVQAGVEVKRLSAVNPAPKRNMNLGTTSATITTT
jgi:hypothetical protein